MQPAKVHRSSSRLDDFFSSQILTQMTGVFSSLLWLLGNLHGDRLTANTGIYSEAACVGNTPTGVSVVPGNMQAPLFWPIRERRSNKRADRNEGSLCCCEVGHRRCSPSGGALQCQLLKKQQLRAVSQPHVQRHTQGNFLFR